MPATYYRDAFFIGIGGAGALIGLQTVIQAIAQHWPTPHRGAPAEFGSNFDAYVPAGAILGTSLLHSLLYMGFVALAATIRRVGASADLAQGARLFRGDVCDDAEQLGQTGADYAKQWIAGTILLAVLVLGVRYVMRFNIFGCFLVVGVTSLASGAAELLGQPDRFLPAQRLRRRRGARVAAGVAADELEKRAAWTTATTLPESEIGGSTACRPPLQRSQTYRYKYLGWIRWRLDWARSCSI